MSSAGNSAQPPVARRRMGQRGVVLISLLVGITVMIILLTASVQSWATVMQRERELELIFRGNQYITALQQYAKEHGGAYPMELEDLAKEGPMGHRYIRQMFTDPFDKKGEWNLLYLAPTGKGFINPNARFPAGGVIGAGGRPLGAGGGVMGGAPQNRVPGLEDLGRGGDDRSGFDRGGSGFGGATMSGPIVGVVSRSGTWFSFGDLRLGQGRNNSRQFLIENKDVAESIESELRQMLGLVAAPDEPATEAEPENKD